MNAGQHIKKFDLINERIKKVKEFVENNSQTV